MMLTRGLGLRLQVYIMSYELALSVNRLSANWELSLLLQTSLLHEQRFCSRSFCWCICFLHVQWTGNCTCNDIQLHVQQINKRDICSCNDHCPQVHTCFAHATNQQVVLLHVQLQPSLARAMFQVCTCMQSESCTSVYLYGMCCTCREKVARAYTVARVIGNASQKRSVR